jgi:hypothetical protein
MTQVLSQADAIALIKRIEQLENVVMTQNNYIENLVLGNQENAKKIQNLEHFEEKKTQKIESNEVKISQQETALVQLTHKIEQINNQLQNQHVLNTHYQKYIVLLGQECTFLREKNEILVSENKKFEMSISSLKDDHTVLQNNHIVAKTTYDKFQKEVVEWLDYLYKLQRKQFEYFDKNFDKNNQNFVNNFYQNFNQNFLPSILKTLPHWIESIIKKKSVTTVNEAKSINIGFSEGKTSAVEMNFEEEKTDEIEKKIEKKPMFNTFEPSSGDLSDIDVDYYDDNDDEDNDNGNVINFDDERTVNDTTIESEGENDDKIFLTKMIKKQFKNEQIKLFKNNSDQVYETPPSTIRSSVNNNSPKLPTLHGNKTSKCHSDIFFNNLNNPSKNDNFQNNDPNFDPNLNNLYSTLSSLSNNQHSNSMYDQ